MEKYSSTNSIFNSVFLKTAAALVAANFFFGTNVIAVKKISPLYISPISLGYLRMIFASVVFFILPYIIGKKEKIKKEDFPVILFAALTGISLNQVLSINGIANTNPVHASLLNMATPIFVSILATVFLKEKFGLNKAIGLILGIAGAWMMIISRNSGNSNLPATIFGDAMVLIAAVCYSSYLILIKKIAGKYHFTTILKYVFFIGTILSTPYCFNDFVNVPWHTFPTSSFYWLFHVLFLATFLSYLLMNWGVQQWGPSKTGSFVYFQPLFGTLGAVFLLNEQLTLVKILAGILIIAGVWINSMQLKKKTSQ
ncbi:MAG: DMT family transporter [Chitinophagaceae bacterium]